MTRTKGYGSITLIREPLPPELKGKEGKDGKPLKGKPLKDKEGRSIWLVRLDLGTDAESEKRNRPSRKVHGTKADAKKELAEWKHEVETGLKVDASEVTFKQYADEWRNIRVTMGEIRPRTQRMEADTLNAVCRYIGSVPIPDLDTATIKRVYAQMKNDGASPDTLHKRHMKLKQVLSSAVDDDLILRNPCDKVSIPKPKPRDKRESLTKEQAAHLYAILNEEGDNDSRIIGVRIGLASGMRIGEVMGLNWDHVDLEAQTLEVVQQHTAKDGNCPPKTDSSVRKIELDADTVKHLSAWKAEQKKQLSALWIKQKATTPVVTDKLGGYHNPDNYRTWFEGFCVAHGFGRWFTDSGENVTPTEHNPDGSRKDGNGHDASGKPYSRCNPKHEKDENGKRRKQPTRHYVGLRFHELRHTQATLLIAAGTDIKTVQHRLGHSSAMMTLDLYAHAMPSNDRKAADTIGAIFSETVPDKGKVVGLDG